MYLGAPGTSVIFGISRIDNNLFTWHANTSSPNRKVKKDFISELESKKFAIARIPFNLSMKITKIFLYKKIYMIFLFFAMYNLLRILIYISNKKNYKNTFL